MRRLIVLCFCVLLSATALYADSKDPADYPLRIHIYSSSETNFYRREYIDESKGEGRANLFENSVPHGVNFSFECEQKLKASFGYETYAARWKKPGKELVVLLPVFGQTGHYFTCNFKTDVQDFAYTMHNRRIGSEPVETYKAWMVRYDYDPEHGKNMPVRNDAPDAADPAQ